VKYGLARSEGADARVSEVLELMGLSACAGRLPSELSGGERQKLALARALGPRPRLLLLDEPFSSLDGPMRDQLRSEVRDLLSSAGTPAVIVTHDVSEALAIGDQILVMIDGRIEQVGPLTEVLNRPANAGVAAAVGFEVVVPGQVLSTNGSVARVQVGNAVLHAENWGSLNGRVLVCIRAHDVTLTPSAEAVTSLRGRITQVRPGMPLTQLSIDCGFSLKASVPPDRIQALGLRIGSEVCASINPAKVRLLPTA
jgi:molybdate transport system ATP-binding protein